MNDCARESLARWLQKSGLGQYADAFAAAKIGWDVVADLSDADLRELGLPIGDRKRLLQALSAMSESQTASPVPETHGAANPVAIADAERRQLTVLFCDLVGSTELSQRLDPEQYRNSVRAYQTICEGVIARYDGHIAQYLGDGLLVYFGYPRAHEDDAQRAIRSALGIIEAIASGTIPNGPLSVRIGVHTGLVVVGDIGSGSTQEQLALGDTPNVAARLQGLAQPNCVVISARTHQLAAGHFEYLDLGSHTLKGVAEPVRAWQPLNESAARTRFDAARQQTVAPMIGRDLELAVLMHAWQRAISGKGQFLSLCGEPGIGKSRLLQALREQIADDAIVPWQYQCSPYFTNTALYPVIDNFERTLPFGRDESSESKLSKLAQWLERFGRPAMDVNLIGRLLSLPAETEYGPLDMTAQKQKDETLRALHDLILSATQAAPVVMMVEDIHWADASTLESLELLLRKMEHAAMLVLVTYRPEFKPAWIGLPLVTTLTLSRLSAGDTKTMVQQVAREAALPADVVQSIVAKTDGIPLFIEELTKTIVESGGLAVREQRSSENLIPATLRDSLMSRLDRLTSAKEVSQIGACIGREFSLQLVTEVAPLAPTQLEEGLEALLASELIFKRGAATGTNFIFKHALIQEAAYDSLLKSRRCELHARIARALEDRFPEVAVAQPELLAHHLTAAELTEKAIGYWHKAAQYELRKLAVRESIRHSEHGLELISTLPPSRARDSQELELQATLGWSCLYIYGWAHPKMRAHLERAWELTRSLGSRKDVLRILSGLWLNELCSGRVRNSLTWCDLMIEEAAKSGNADLELMGEMQLANSFRFLGEFSKANDCADAALARYDFAQHRHVLELLNYDAKTSALLFKAHAQWSLGYPDTAQRLCEETILHARACGNPGNICWSLTESSLIFGACGDMSRAFSGLSQAEALAREQGLPLYSDGVVPIVRCVLLLRSRGYDAAQAESKQAIAAWSQAGAEIGMTYNKVTQAEAAANAGHLQEADGILGEAFEQAARAGWEERQYLSELFKVKALLRSLLDDVPGAEQNYLEGLAVARSQNAKSCELRVATAYARFLAQRARAPEAFALLTPIYEWFTEGRSTQDHLDAKALLDELSNEPGRTMSAT